MFTEGCYGQTQVPAPAGLSSSVVHGRFLQPSGFPSRILSGPRCASFAFFAGSAFSFHSTDPLSLKNV